VILGPIVSSMAHARRLSQSKNLIVELPQKPVRREFLPPLYKRRGDGINAQGEMHWRTRVAGLELWGEFVNLLCFSDGATMPLAARFLPSTA
jgi:hypothetical protein